MLYAIGGYAGYAEYGYAYGALYARCAPGTAPYAYSRVGAYVRGALYATAGDKMAAPGSGAGAAKARAKNARKDN